MDDDWGYPQSTWETSICLCLPSGFMYKEALKVDFKRGTPIFIPKKKPPSDGKSSYTPIGCGSNHKGAYKEPLIDGCHKSAVIGFIDPP